MPSPSAKKVTVASPKKAAARIPPPHFMEDVLAFFFAIVEPEIVKTHPTYISPTVDEFVYGLKRINKTFGAALGTLKTAEKRRQTRRRRGSASTSTKKSKQTAGAENQLSENMQILFSVFVGGAIGTFDTPCAQLFSYIAIMLYALWGYKLVSDRLPQALPGADTALMVSDPAGTITDIVVEYVRRHIPSLSMGIQRFENSLEQYSRQVEISYEAEKTRWRHAEHVFASRMIPVLKRLVVMQTYKVYVVIPIACGLAALGIESCWRECMQTLARDTDI